MMGGFTNPAIESDRKNHTSNQHQVNIEKFGEMFDQNINRGIASHGKLIDAIDEEPANWGDKR